MAKGTGKRYTGDGKLIQNTTIKVRLYPTPEQAGFFDKTFDCCRYLWNQMLADEREFYAATDEHFIPTPARYKKSTPFLKEADSQALVSVHQNLRLAFQRFFDQPEHYRYPVFKREGGTSAYTIYCQYYPSGRGSSIYLTENAIRLPKAGLVRAKLHRKPLHWWRLKTATVSKSPSGSYFCSLMYEYTGKEPEQVAPTNQSTLGIQYSPAHFYVDSQGHRADPPRWLRESQDKLAGMQRRLSRMERGSNNYREQLRKIQKLQEHIANQRMDFIHKESRRLADKWDAVCVRDVDLQRQSQRERFPYQMESGFGTFRTCLQYKLERQGKAYIPVNEYLTSAKQIRDRGLEEFKK